MTGGFTRRSLLQVLGAAGGLGAMTGTAAAEAPSPEPPATDPHTKLVFSAAADAVIPRTPRLGATLGEEHVPGALEVGLDEFLITFTNHLFTGVTPLADRTQDLRLTEVVALVLEVAATELVATAGNEDPPSTKYAEGIVEQSSMVDSAIDVAAAGLFPRLSPHDRFKAITLLDDTELDTTVLADRLPPVMFEYDLGLIGTLLVGFGEVIYYSEWQGYEAFTVPPSEREFTNDPSAVQSWRQSGFPGFADGYQAFRGYWGTPDSSLGEGRVWRVRRPHGDGPPNRLTFESGEFRENDYDTSDYEEVFPPDDTGDGDATLQVGGTEGNLLYELDGVLGDGDGNVEVGQGEGGLLGSVTGPIFGASGGETDPIDGRSGGEL
jgi:hypothetical protein